MNNTNFSDEELQDMGSTPTEQALGVIRRYGGIDGEHHKQWVLDQVVRILTGEGYPQWVREQCDGEDGPETYGWDAGIAP